MSGAAIHDLASAAIVVAFVFAMVMTMVPSGWSCEKGTDMGRHLDARVAAGTMVARGDNCEGLASR